MPRDTPPWNPWILLPVSFLFSVLAGGILAGLNFRRLGKPSLLWPSILLTTVLFLGVVALGEYGFVSPYIGYTVHGGGGLILWTLQRVDYQRWQAVYGKSWTGGVVVPFLVIVMVTAVMVALLFALDWTR